MSSKGGRPSTGTDKDQRLRENNPNAGKKPAQGNSTPKKPKKA